MTRVVFRSWTPEWTAFEVARLQKIGLPWVDGHKTTPGPDDIYLTVNGQDFIDSPCLKATYYAETYHYLQAEYDNFHKDTKWGVRFVFKPDLLKHLDTYHVHMPGYWEMDGKSAFSNHPDQRDKTFGMVLTKKHQKYSACDLGLLRAEFVEALYDHPSFSYWGAGWAPGGQNYHGEFYHGFDKHLSSRLLLSRCKFALVIDTSNVNGWLSEKFWQALAAGCIPIYFGHESIHATVPKDVYIYGFDFPSIPDLIDFCEELDDSAVERRQRAGREFFLADRTHSWEHAYKSMNLILQTQKELT